MKDLFDSIDQAIEINEKLSSENNRLTIALQEIRDIPLTSYGNEDAYDMNRIACKALEGEEDPVVKVNHEGHLYSFGESSTEVEYLGDVNPFERVKENK